ncbi:DUF2185 domain-containing protein [Enterovibrio baiacu]|uniref:DUF2185 domain-containing protein n=1 Tax=Enterovibrio baiacu TaxID=2491023 RepID=UPI0010137A37|nr:DUF2185 domain-containing protein [Enterovibrio baiacu]MBE1273730.1 DUF2185 domain-containing protein [Enterovibrio baiacu]
MTQHTELNGKSSHSPILLGYVIVNKELIDNGKSIGYFYREEPDSNEDSGWRFFTGEETQEFVDNADNFVLYSAPKLAALHPEILPFLSLKAPVELEWFEDAYVIVEEALLDQ